MRRILAVAIVVLGSLVSMASPVAAAGGPWSVVSSGAWHTCAINTGKDLYCWGYNGTGQIGDGTTTQRSSPKRVGATGAWASVSAGEGHTCAISSGKNLYCWGHNAYGQIGDGATTSPRLSPRKVGSSGVWASVSAGGRHTCAISTGKNLYCWGYNSFGQVGDGTTTALRPSPRKVGSSGVWESVSAGGVHTCAISVGKNLYCWGDNVNGSVGDGTTTPRPSPTQVSASGIWAKVDTGYPHTCAITTAKDLYCWGYNGTGAVGDGTTTTPRPSPTKIGASGIWARASAGGNGAAAHTCATTSANSLYCWGTGSRGQVGDGTTANPRPSPTKVGSSGVWAGSTAGGVHSCAISTGKSLYCWGDNTVGQVGDGTTTSPRLSPRRVP